MKYYLKVLSKRSCYLCFTEKKCKVESNSGTITKNSS